VLANEYFLHSGDWYAGLGGLVDIKAEPAERMLTPLPLFHMNALACSLMAMIETGGCLILLDRFHPATWWDSVRRSGATIIHYLGIMPTILMAHPESAEDQSHTVRWAFGAGVERALHAPFENRFGFPLIEAWGMTETGMSGAFIAADGDRHVGTNCFGRAAASAEHRIIADTGQAAAIGQPGELQVRSKGADPRFGFFDGYLKDQAATGEAWRGGWFHTGDVVRENPDGTLVFIDRIKNVIRRSGENIAAAEVEATLIKHPAIESVAVCATPDAVRGDEVFACIVLSGQTNQSDLARTATDITRWCLTELAYFKAPGYIAFIDALPLTATNKVQRGKLGERVAELVASGSFIDTRALKKRTAA
jgi:acyl-CoA synthetase (AMP-forming)/AMP-acid ligase II